MPYLGTGQQWPIGRLSFGLLPVNSDWLRKAGVGPRLRDLSPDSRA